MFPSSIPFYAHVVSSIRVIPAIGALLAGFSTADAQVDTTINREVWKQKYGVLDAQFDQQSPYTGWLDQDADGDGVMNRTEFIAGTNPFRKSPTQSHFHPPSVAMEPTSLSLTFPTEIGKFYTVQSNATLMDAWSQTGLPSVIGDGTNKTLVVPKSAGNFFHIGVSDQATQGDQVSDWAKHSLGLSMAAPIQNQTSFDHNSLAANLQSENVVTLSVSDGAGTQPPDASVPAGDFAIIQVTRSGAILIGDITVPLTKSGTAVEGIDYAPLPAAVTFPSGVSSLDVKIIPRPNAGRTSSATVFLSAAAPDASAAVGNYTLGSPSSAGVTLYPASAPTGTGLTANYYSGSSSNYASPLNFGGKTASYGYGKSGSTVTATITYSGTSAIPLTAGNPVRLRFSSNNLNINPHNTEKTYTITSGNGSTSFVITFDSTVSQASGTGSCEVGNFFAPFTRVDPVVDFAWGNGSPNPSIPVDNFSSRWTGQVLPQYSQKYYFIVNGDDGIKLWINGQPQVLRRLTSDNPSVTYNYTQNSSTNGTVVLTYNSAPISVGDVIPLRFTTGTLNTSQFNTSKPYTVTAVTATTFTVILTGTNMPASDLTNGSKCTIDTINLPIDWIYSSVDRYCTLPLQAGVYYDIKLEHYDGSGGAQSRLWWYSDDQARQIIPSNRLFPTITGGTPFGGAPTPAAPTITSPTEVVTILGSDTPFSLDVTSSNGGAVTASDLPSWLTLVNGVLSGTPPAAGIYQFTLTTTNSAGTGSSVMTIEVLATPNHLTRETWTSGVSGTTLASVPWTNPPATNSTVANAESNASDGGANTGERLRGFFIAPNTGNYYFWIAASNVAELHISNDGEPVNKVLRASVNANSTVPPKNWNVQSNQKSAWLALVAGRKYYLEVLHNTGATGAANHLAVAWYLDPTGNAVNPVPNSASPAAPTPGGVIPGYALSPWDNPPTTSVPGTLYVTNLQGADGLSGITGTGGAFLRVNGNSAILQLDYSGLTSGATSRSIKNSSGTVLFDVNSQEKNYPNLKSSDGGYTWNLSPTDLTALQNGEVRIEIATLNNPTGELTGTFGVTAGSQTPPPVPSYSVPDSHPSSDAAASRFLTQATFGPSPSDIASVKSSGYRAWIENQFTQPATKNVPYILSNLSNDPQNAYGSTLMFNSWWKNSVTAPDQLRQRAAFALSQILVVSDVGPLNNNGRVLADYYDTLLDQSFGNFRDILKQVTLSPAMGVYLDMRGNTAGNISTGQIPNENYAREILQLFSAGLYRIWPDGSLVLNSSGQAVPTYDQSVITGYARVFTGWNWGQAMSGGRLPTGFSPSANYLDPMVLVPTRHELGTKTLLDNVMLPAATIINQSDTSTDPASTFTVQSTDPALGAGNLVITPITNRYDLNGVKDLEAALDKIMENSAVAPYICRQLIQRLVTSDPKPEYVHRVVRAYHGERNVDGVATGLRGDMKEVFRAILLDYEARDPAAAADPRYGKQREPLLRVTGPARSFPVADIPNCTYRQIGFQNILVTTPIPHRLAGETVRLSDFVDEGGSVAAHRVPTTQPYGTADSSPSYSLAGSTGIVTVTSPGYRPGDVVQIRFSTGTLGSTAPYNTLRSYTVVSVTPANFTVNLGTTALGNTSGTALLPYQFTIRNNATLVPNYTSVGNTVTLTHSQLTSGIQAAATGIPASQVFIRFASGGLVGAGYDRVYTVESATATEFTITLTATTPPANTNGTALIPSVSGGYNVTTSGSASTILIQHSGNHNLVAGDPVFVRFLVTNPGTPAPSGLYSVASVNGPNSFRITTTPAVTNGSQGTGGMVGYPLKLDATQWTRSGTVTLGFSTWNLSRTDNSLNQTPLNSTTVFNFFYPDYRFPGDIAKAGMTTPEFQLTNDSSTMVLTNTITQGTLTNNGGNNTGYVSFLGNGVTLDLAPYLTAEQTSNTGVPILIDNLNALLTSGNLTGATKTHIRNYVANTSNFPLDATPTAAQIRNRVRAIVHLIVTSAEYAIQR